MYRYIYIYTQAIDFYEGHVCLKKLKHPVIMIPFGVVNGNYTLCKSVL